MSEADFQKVDQKAFWTPCWEPPPPHLRGTAGCGKILVTLWMKENNEALILDAQHVTSATVFPWEGIGFQFPLPGGGFTSISHTILVVSC